MLPNILVRNNRKSGFNLDQSKFHRQKSDKGLNKIRSNSTSHIKIENVS